MKFSLGIITSLLFSSHLMAAPTMIKVDFISYGAGIDSKAYETITGILGIEKDYGNVTSIEEHSWGREGEKTLCARFSTLNDQSRTKEILDLVAGKQSQVQYSHHCQSQPDPIVVCTADANPWNNPSFCQCGESETYNPRQGKCMSRFLSGVLQPAAAVGGEAAQFLLVSYDGKTMTEVSFPDHLYETAVKFAEKGLPTEISGEYKTIHTVERGAWVLFKADSINWED